MALEKFTNHINVDVLLMNGALAFVTPSHGCLKLIKTTTVQTVDFCTSRPEFASV